MRIAVFGNFGVHNLGDDLILEGFLKEMSHEGHEVIVFAGQPERVEEQFQVPAYHFFPGGARSLLASWFSPTARRQLKAARQALAAVDRVVIGGGGILVDHRLKALILWYAQLRSIRRLKKPLHFSSNSLELRSPLSRHLFKPFLQSAEQVSVRDRASQDLLQEFGVISSLVPDLALSADLEAPVHPQPKTIALALCRWGLGSAQLFSLKTFCAQLQEQGYQLVPLAFQTLGDDDREVYAELGFQVPVLTERQHILQALQNSSLLIGMRFHSILLALHFNTPVLALPYQHKVAALMTERGRGDHLIAIPDLNLQNLQAHFEKVIEEGQARS